MATKKTGNQTSLRISQKGEMMNKQYLGDSVYVEFNGHKLVLTTFENGDENDPSNIIVLEPEVQLALAEYIEKLYKEKNHNERMKNI